MNRHRFSAALTSIDRAHALGPATVISLGLESDALVELGRYDQALDRVQRMLDIDPGLPALSRAAHLRFLYGDTEGAISLLHAPVLERTGERERAKIALQLAELYVHLSEVEAAEAAANNAALLLPDNAQPLAMRARIAEARARPDEALALYLRAQSVLPSPEYALGAWRMGRMLGERKVEKRQRSLLEGMARLDETQGGLYRRVFIEFFGAQSQRLPDASVLLALIWPSGRTCMRMHGWPGHCWRVVSTTRLRHMRKRYAWERATRSREHCSANPRALHRDDANVAACTAPERCFDGVMAGWLGLWGSVAGAHPLGNSTVTASRHRRARRAGRGALSSRPRRDPRADCPGRGRRRRRR